MRDLEAYAQARLTLVLARLRELAETKHVLQAIDAGYLSEASVYYARWNNEVQRVLRAGKLDESADAFASLTDSLADPQHEITDLLQERRAFLDALIAKIDSSSLQ